MNKRRLSIMVLSCSLAVSAFAAENNTSDAGAIEFGRFDPPRNGEFVEINVSRGLICMAVRLIESSEPEVAEILNGLKSIRVTVTGLDNSNRADVRQRIEKVRLQLDRNGWERLVTVKEGDEEVGVFTKLRGEEIIEGIVITVIDGDDEAVMVNVVGDVRPEQLALVAERLNIEPLEEISRKFGHRR